METVKSLMSKYWYVTLALALFGLWGVWGMYIKPRLAVAQAAK